MTKRKLKTLELQNTKKKKTLKINKSKTPPLHTKKIIKDPKND